MIDQLIGQKIGGYQILELVGQGGMATVYRAHQISINRHVAIKILPLQFLHQSTSLDRFKQEASIVARLEHRAIVPVYDYGEYEGMPYLVMRYMDGGSVDEQLAKGPILPKKTLLLLQQIAPALDYAHREGVLHRDLKPSNVLLDSNGDAYITDFGIARIFRANPQPLTTSGVVGTPSYMSPEQAQGHDLDERSDVYALGVVLFEMLTGVRPFEGETPYSVAVKHVTEAPPSASDINPHLCRAIEHVLFKALAKNRDMRYAAAEDLVVALRLAINNPPEATTHEAMLLETAPVPHETLEVAEQHGAASAPSAQMTAPPVPSPNIPNSQALPAYNPAEPRFYTGSLGPPRQRKQFSDIASWLTWTLAGVFVGAVLLVVVLGSIYYWVNSNEAQRSEQADYSATAIFKLTATKRALQSPAQPLTATEELMPLFQSTPIPTAPPTKTSRAPN